MLGIIVVYFDSSWAYWGKNGCCWDSVFSSSLGVSLSSISIRSLPIMMFWVRVEIDIPVSSDCWLWLTSVVNPLTQAFSWAICCPKPSSSSSSSQKALMRPFFYCLRDFMMREDWKAVLWSARDCSSFVYFSNGVEKILFWKPWEMRSSMLYSCCWTLEAANWALCCSRIFLASISSFNSSWSIITMAFWVPFGACMFTWEFWAKFKFS